MLVRVRYSILKGNGSREFEILFVVYYPNVGKLAKLQNLVGDNIFSALKPGKIHLYLLLYCKKVSVKNGGHFQISITIDKCHFTSHNIYLVIKICFEENFCITYNNALLQLKVFCSFRPISRCFRDLQ